jgi:hypothetical protein
MLGKSTADRHHAFKEHRRLQNELLHRSSLGENDAEKIENALISVASAKLLTTNFREYYNESYASINSNIKQNFTSCIQNTFFNTSQDNLENFLSHLIQEEYNSFIKCSDDLKKFLQTIN